MNFTIINETDKCKSPYGNYPISISEIKKEDYTTLSLVMSTITTVLDELKTINIHGRDFKIILYFGGDLKFLLNIYGIFL